MSPLCLCVYMHRQYIIIYNVTLKELKNGIDELKTLLNFQCEEADRALLSHDVPAIEIKHVLFAMAKNKSPGPDGYTCEFFKVAWDIVGDDFVIAV